MEKWTVLGIVAALITSFVSIGVVILFGGDFILFTAALIITGLIIEEFASGYGCTETFEVSNILVLSVVFMVVWVWAMG